MAIADESSPAAAEAAKPRRSPWVHRLISPSSGQLTLAGHLALAGTLLLGSLTINAWMFTFATRQERDWLNLASMSKTVEQGQTLAANVGGTPAEVNRMVEQMITIQLRVATHAEVMGLFYKLNFIALGTVGLATGVASITLFFISKVGWERANNALINLFIVATGLVIFHSNLIFIFKFQDNIRLNSQLYSEYTRLYNAMLSYWAIQPTAPNSLTPAEFIVATDQQLAELGKISLDFDVSRVAELGNPLDGLGTQPAAK